MRKKRIHHRLTLLLQAVLLVGFILAVIEQRWLTAATTIAIVLITLVPLLAGKRFRVFIPPELELLATVFVFSALFLGEVRGFYVRYWWWDILLHTTSGFLLGIVGFLLVYVLNEKEEPDLHMTPGFVALFAFMFSLGVGALWEIFEFSMDSIFGLNMQKPMFGDASGLTDTMWDLIVDAIGAFVISWMGFGYLKTAGKKSFLEEWIESFMDANPRFFHGSNGGR